MSDMGTSENLAKLKEAGVVTNETFPRVRRRHRRADGRRGEILISVTKRLVSAEHLHKGKRWSPGGAAPLFKSYLLF